MEESIKDKIIKIVGIAIIVVLALVAINSNSKYNTMKDDVDTYKLKISKLEEKKEEYETLIESYKKSQLEDKATIAAHEETITELEKQITNLNTKISKLNVEIVTLKKERDTANSTIKTLNTKITNLNNTIDENKLTIDNLNDTITNHKLTITNLNTELTNTNNKITELTTTNETLNTNITKLTTKLATIDKYHVVNSEIELIEALKEGGNIILKTNIIMSSNIVLEDIYASIDLNGFNLVVTHIKLKDSSLEIKNSKNLNNLSIIGDNEDLTYGFEIGDASTLKISNGNYNGQNLFQVKDNGSLYIVYGVFDNVEEEVIVKEENATVEVFESVFEVPFV